MRLVGEARADGVGALSSCSCLQSRGFIIIIIIIMIIVMIIIIILFIYLFIYLLIIIIVFFLGGGSEIIGFRV